MMPADVERLRCDPTYASGYREAPACATYFIACNTRRGPLADIQLRRQIAAVIDTPRFARQALGRLEEPAGGLIPPGLLGYEAERGAPAGRLDTPKAASRDVELVCMVHSVFLSAYRAYFTRICDALRALGIRLRVIEGVGDLYEMPDSEQTLDLVITRWFADYPDAHTFCGMLHSREGIFGRFAGSEQFDRLLEKGQVTVDPQVRHGIYRQLEEIIAEEVCMIPLFHPQSYRFARPEIDGLEIGHDGPMVPYEVLSLNGDED